MMRTIHRTLLSMLAATSLLLGCGQSHAQVPPSLLPGAAPPASAAASAAPLTAEELAALVAGAQELVQRLDATATSQPDAPLLARRRALELPG